MPTLGCQIVPARINELRRVLLDLSAEDMAQLDSSIAVNMERPLGRELLAARLPIADTVYVCLYNLEATGLIVLHRGQVAAQIRALAVSPDMRRKGLARSLLAEADRRVLDRGLDWLWMQVPSANQAATRCALSCGFKRYRPQYLTRQYGRAIPCEAQHVRLELLDGDEAGETLLHWLGVELSCGDAWAQPLVESELAMQTRLLPSSGQVWKCVLDGNVIGCAHLLGPEEHPAISLWLDQVAWDRPEELAYVRAVLGTLHEMPAAVDVWLGSEGHLRQSVVRYKALGFKPAVADQVIFARHLQPPE